MLIALCIPVQYQGVKKGLVRDANVLSCESCISFMVQISDFY